MEQLTASPPNDDKFNIVFSHKQSQALDVLADPLTQELMYGGAKGGGKSVFGCYWAYLKAHELITKYKLPQRKYPLIAGFMGRKQYIDFKATTLNTWRKMIPEKYYEIREVEGVRCIVIDNRIAIQLGGMDRSETINKFNSAEFAFYFLDQAEELTQDDIALIRGTRRLIVNGHKPHYVGLLTANPRICWLKTEFITTPDVGNRFIRALPTDNPFLPDEYVPQLQKAFKHRPELLKAYLHGSWDDIDTEFVVIPERHVLKNVKNAQHDKRVIYRLTASDISELAGKDETVIYDLINTRIDNAEIYAHRSLMDTVGRLQAHAKQNKSNMIAADKVGCGAGVVDRLDEIYGDDEEMDVYGFDSRTKGKDVGDGITYGNKRAEAWWHAAEMFAEGRCDIPDDPMLIKQLCGVTYHFRNGRIFIDKKEDLEEKLGCSPDRADAYVIALDALRLARPYYKPDAYDRDDEDDEGYDPMTA